MRRLVFPAFLVCMGHVATASAAPSEGEVLFREGRAAMEAKDYERACTKFAESFRVEPAPGTALNLGECEERRGHPLAASAAFNTAASTFTNAEKQKYAASRLDAVDKRVPRLTVHAPSPPPGLTIQIAGTSTQLTLDAEAKIEVGELTIHVEAPGFRPKELKATAQENKSIEIDVGLLEPIEAAPVIAPPPPPLPPKKTSSGPTFRTIGLAAGGAGAFGLIVGGVTGIMTMGHASTVEEHCDVTLACDAEGLDAADSGSTTSLVSTIGFAAGAALIAVGVVFYLAGGKSSAASARSMGPVIRF